MKETKLMDEIKKNIYINGTVLEDMESVLSQDEKGIWDKDLANKVIQVGEFNNNPSIKIDPSGMIEM